MGKKGAFSCLVSKNAFPVFIWVVNKHLISINLVLTLNVRLRITASVVSHFHYLKYINQSRLELVELTPVPFSIRLHDPTFDGNRVSRLSAE